MAAAPLLKWQDSPSHLQFNRFILTAYRPLLTARGCVKSLFYLHNETINIYSHGLPFFYFLFVLSTEMSWDAFSQHWALRALMVADFSACIGMCVCSTIYHTFMNHRQGATLYRKLLKFDVCGVWATNTFGALTSIYATLHCQSSAQIITIALYLILSLGSLFKVITSKTARDRVLSFVPLAAVRYLMLTLRLLGLGKGSPSSFKHMIYMDMYAFLGGLVNATKVPERWFPGKFDCSFNSHQIMHLLVLMGVLHMHQGAIGDLLWIAEHTCS